MANLFFEFIKKSDFINENWGLSEADALRLSIEIERGLEKLILTKIKQTKSAETKDALVDLLLQIKNINS